MPRYAPNKVPAEVKRRYFKLIRQGLSGASVSKDTVSVITDQVIEEMTGWMSRPLDEGRIPLVVANPEVKGFECPGTHRTRCRKRSSAATSS